MNGNDLLIYVVFPAITGALIGTIGSIAFIWWRDR